MKLSILTMSIPRRRKTLTQRLLDQLEDQIAKSGRNDIEVLCLYDNKKRTIGAKRDAMLKLAQGEYLVFIDDDDLVAEDYIELVMQALDANPDCDCLVYDCVQPLPNGSQILSRYGIELERYDGDMYTKGTCTRKPAHTMVWRSSIAKSVGYIDKQHGEDYDWVNRAWPLIKNQVRIDRVLYFYFWSEAVSESYPG